MTEAPGPLLVASPDTLLLQLAHPAAEQCRAELATFAELEQSPDHVHTYRLTDIGLWNARAASVTPERVLDVLHRYSSGPVPHTMLRSVTDTMDRFGRIVIETSPDAPGGELVVRANEAELLDQLLIHDTIAAMVCRRLDARSVTITATDRGRLKQHLVELRWPADDQAGLSPGLPFPLALRTDELELRSYQHQAVASWLPSGNGVVVLPCGAGKTVTAIAIAAAVGAQTLILVTSEAAMEQWRRELLRFTDVNPDDIGRYTARRKEVRPITLATYHVLATKRNGELRHLDVIQGGDWGLVVYDEVHLLPAAVFQLTAGIQSRRRLGLTATLIREDGRQRDVFSLVGPKRFDVPWRDLELQGWLAPATCTEVRVVPTDDERLVHAKAATRDKPKVAATVGAKAEVVPKLLARHPGQAALVIGTYVDALTTIAEQLDAPLVTGGTPAAERLRLFDQLREGELPLLVVSKVANFSLDLPEVSVAVQVSGTFGSRQEEAQRLGRVLRPKHDGRQAHFYSVVARDTVEQDHAARRQRFLTEQGYAYEIIDAAEV